MQTKIQINPLHKEQLENAGENSSLRHQRGNGAVKKILQVQDPVQGRNKKKFTLGFGAIFPLGIFAISGRGNSKRNWDRAFLMLRDPGHGSAKFYK